MIPQPVAIKWFKRLVKMFILAGEIEKRFFTGFQALPSDTEIDQQQLNSVSERQKTAEKWKS